MRKEPQQNDLTPRQPMSGGKRTEDHQSEGENKKIRESVHPTIAQTLQLIFNKYSYKLKLSTLL